MPYWIKPDAVSSGEEFYEITHSCMRTIDNTRELLELDAVLNEVVLNLWADDDSVSVIKLNPPYNMQVDLGKISTGRRTDTLNEPVLDTLHSLLLKFGSIQTGLRSLNLSLEGLMSKPTTDLQFLL